MTTSTYAGTVSGMTRAHCVSSVFVVGNSLRLRRFSAAGEA